MSQKKQGQTVDRSLAVLGIIFSSIGLFAVGRVVYGQYSQYDFSLGQVTILGGGLSPTITTQTITTTTTYTDASEVNTLMATIQNQQNTIREQNDTIRA